MNSYILLRDNKESGALSIEELRRSGLRSTDLIWVECQSWDWQRPDEIPELKALLAGYDQDLTATSKKGSTIKTDRPGLKVKYTVMPETDPIDPVPVPDISKEKVEAQIEVSKEEKPIPAGKPRIRIRVPVVSETEDDHQQKASENDMYKYGGLTATDKEKENPAVEIQTRYSRPLDEIKELYVKNMEQRTKKQKGFIAIQLPEKHKKAAVYIGLVAVGALVMLLINNFGNKKTALVQSQQQASLSSVTKDTAGITTIPVETTEQTIAEDPAVVADEKTVPITAAEKRTTIVTPAEEKKTVIETGTATSEDIPVKNTPAEPEATLTKPVQAENISSKLTLKANDYTVGSFGGIRNLQMTIQNNSKYLLDKVIVELKYLNLDGIAVKTESIHFESVPPGETETVPVKKTNRGMKVVYTITKIESKEINNSTTGL